MELTQLACPLCDGIFQVDIAWQGTQVECPHCQQAVTVPALGLIAPAEAPEIAVQSDEDGAEAVERSSAKDSSRRPIQAISRIEELKLARRLPDEKTGMSPYAVHESAPRVATSSGETVELQWRSPYQQARLRNRWQLGIALLGVVLLVALMFALLQLAP